MKIIYYIKIIIRALKLAFKANRKVHMIYLKCDRQFLFKQAVVTLSYYFDNALYYKINGKLSLDTFPKTLTVANTTYIDFQVFGLFQKRRYKLPISAVYEMKNSSFNVSKKKMNPELQQQHLSVSTHKKILVTNPKINIKANNPNIDIPNMKINHQFYNLNDFL